MAKSRLTPLRRGFLAVSGGTAIGQIAVLALAPIISRLYSPADFGTFTIVAAISAIIGTVAALRFELAVPLPRSRTAAHFVALLGISLSLAVAILGTGAVFLFGSALASVVDAPALMPWLYAVPPIAGLTGGVLVLSQLAIREGRFTALGRRNAINAMLGSVAQAVFGALGLRSGGLVSGYFVGHVVGTLSLLRGSHLGKTRMAWPRATRLLKATAYRYRTFPILLAPAGLLNVAGVQLPVLLIAYLYGAEVAGWLGLTQRVLAMPMMLIGAAVAQVYVSAFAKAARTSSGESHHFFRASSVRLSIVAASLTPPIVLFGPWAFRTIFGEDWTQSGHYARALAIGLAAQLVAVPLSQTLTVLERLSMQLLWDAGRLIVVLGAVAVCWILGGSALQCVWALSIASAVAYVGSWILSRSAARAAPLGARN